MQILSVCFLMQALSKQLVFLTTDDYSWKDSLKLKLKEILKTNRKWFIYKCKVDCPKEITFCLINPDNLNTVPQYIEVENPGHLYNVLKFHFFHTNKVLTQGWHGTSSREDWKLNISTSQFQHRKMRNLSLHLHTSIDILMTWCNTSPKLTSFYNGSFHKNFDHKKIKVKCLDKNKLGCLQNVWT